MSDMPRGFDVDAYLDHLTDLREQAGVAATKPYRNVMRFAEVKASLVDQRFRVDFARFFEAMGISGGAFLETVRVSPLNQDGESHRRWRALVAKAFTPNSVDALRPFLLAAADRLIDGFIDAGRCDFMESFAESFPLLALSELIGVPPGDYDEFHQWASMLASGMAELPVRIREVDEAMAKLLDYADRLAGERRLAPRDDLVSRLAVAAVADDLPLSIVKMTVAGLIVAGHEAAKNQIGIMLAVLAEHPAVWAALADGSVSPAAVSEEVLRHRSSNAAVGRVVCERVDRAGVCFDAGEQVVLSLWSANHDIRAFADPDRFHVQPRDVSHLAFGYGPHFCVGAALVRAELQTAFARLSQRITCPVVGDDAHWKPPLGLSGPTYLPIVFQRRSLPG